MWRNELKHLIVTLAAIILAMAMSVAGQGIPSSSGKPGSSSIDSVASTDSGLRQRNPRYQLRKGDSFDVEFAFSPELNQTLSVQPDGYVTLKTVGSIFVEGQTVPELTETLQTAYSKTLHAPVITVALKDFDKPYFIAAGQVTKPGKYDLRGPLTVTEAVAIAGGFNDSAKHSQVVLFHPTANGVFEAKLINAKKLLANRNLSEDVYLQAGDMLYVPQSAFSRIRRYIPSTSMGAFYNPAVF